MNNSKTLSIIIKAQDQASKVFDRVGGKINDVAKKAVSVAKVAGATVAAAVTAATIGGGISRALNIEDAQAKLRGLGHDVKSIEAIMGSALKSVKGTAFGLDQAATAAAGAVAAGVKPGKELTRYLSLAGDAATIAGTSFSEMGSIFGKVQTQQRAYTMELNMLADRGIPIYQWLQKELGVSQEKLREMVAAGKVDSEVYFRAIEKNIGGAALESGKTTRGAWNNMLAAMARVGEAIVKDIIPKVRESFGSMTKWLDSNSGTIVNSVSKAADYVKTFGGNFVTVAKQAGSYLQPKLVALGNSIQKIMPTLKALGENFVVPLSKAFGVTLVWGIGKVIDVANLLVSAMRPILNWMNANRSAVVAFAASLTTLWVAMRMHQAFITLQSALVTLRMGFVASTVATVGWSGALGALSTAAKGFMLSLGPLGLAVTVITALAGALAGAWASGAARADAQKAAQDRLREATDALKESKDRLSGAELGVEGAALRVERAQKAAKEATAMYGAKSLEAREATHHLKQAQQDLKRAHDEAREATNRHRKAEEEYAKSGGLIVSAEKKRKAMQGLYDALNQKVNTDFQYKDPHQTSLNSPMLKKLPGNATGTDYWRGGRTLVGEHGPEIVDLPRGSKVYSNKQSQDMVDGATFNMYGNISLGSAGAVDRFFERLNAQKELGNLGVGI